MDVFIPALNDGNPFFDEIMFYSKHNFIFDDFKEYKPIYKAVLIHWPEQIFKWKEPTKGDLIALVESISLWKQHSKIMYTVHNLERHYGMTTNFEKLYQIVENSCDSMLHFGKYSYDLFSEKYPNKKHSIIPHPLYEKSFTIHSKEFARKALNIKKKTLVIIAPGAIRNKDERKLILKSFKNIKQKNKILIVPRMLKFDFPYEFKGRIFLKKFFDIKKKYENYIKDKYQKPYYHFGFNFSSIEDLSLMMSAADIVFIPRINILNSGNIFLGMTYKKIMVGPDCGNIGEVLKRLKLPLFNPNDLKSVKKSLQKAVQLYETDVYTYDDKLLNEFKPIIIAEQLDDYLVSL